MCLNRHFLSIRDGTKRVELVKIEMKANVDHMLLNSRAHDFERLLEDVVPHVVRTRATWKRLMQ